MLKRIVCVMFCLLLCLQVCAAPAEEGIESVILNFMEEHGLDESNFSVSYYNEKTGDAYSFNDKMFVPMGKLWTLPLNMYFYEEESLGNFAPEKINPENPQELLIDGNTLEECRYHSIIMGDQNVSLAMRDHIGTVMQYLQEVNSRYVQLPLDAFPEEFWNGNIYSVQFMMNCIRMVSAHPENFGELMANFYMAQKAEAFADGSLPYFVVQVHGAEGGFVTAAGEVSAHQSYLLVASVAESAGGDATLGALNKAICDFVDQSAEEDENVATTDATQASRAPNYYVGQDRIHDNSERTRWLLIAFAIAGGIAAILGTIHLILRNKHREY
ncbi:MAG: hypothetical protein IKT58_07000 [Oscillospiraceae bacterium]|nr:hypothetical protein [Oscillospiraceae bacterium]